MAKRIKKPVPYRFRPATLRLMLTEEEKAELKRAAEIEGLQVSAWLRALGLRAARKITGAKK
jgi:uncharacterized protein (DUF1778 family)